MLSRVIGNGSGSAAAEMALVTPLLMALIFGSLELGNYFLTNHIVTKAVRDGARYASRRGFSEYGCPSTVSSDVVDKTRNVTRTGQVAAGGTPRLAYWDAANAATTITITVRCDTSGTYTGVYSGMAGVPVVQVRAVVPYGAVLSTLGFNTTGFSISAQSEVTVMGV